jgi:hypothetical protein
VAADENLLGQSLLTDYGKCLSVYHGKGVLTLEDGRKYDCQFEAGQLKNGYVLLLCDFLLPFPACSRIPAAKFEGMTSEGFGICSNKGINEVNYLPGIPNGRSSGTWAAFHLDEMLVQIIEYGQTQRLHFGVTNFEFLGTERLCQSDNYYCHFLPLNFENVRGLTNLSIKPLKLYDKIVQRIKTLKGIDVSCEVIAEIPTDGNIFGVTEVVDDLCYVLSVARGTKIQWVYCDQYDVTRKLISRTHSSRITKRYCPLKIIDPIAGGGKETKTFIEQAYRAYVEKRESLKLSKGTIDAYLDAKAEADFLEMRGVKFAVAMEILKTVFHKVTEIKGGSFRSIIENLCNFINLQIDPQEINLFVACRNSLIHEGKFYCETATPKKRNRCKPLNTKPEEYLFLVNFLDKVFLKLSGYSGPYIDWRIPGNPIHRDQV